MFRRPPRPMTLDETRLFCELVHDACGVSHGIDTSHFLSHKLGPRLEELQLATFTDYYHFIRYDTRGPEELVYLVEAITTHETYFFREQYQLDALTKEILPAIRAENAGTRQLRIWSAGCSSGEEVYTLAMIVLKSGMFEGWDVDVIGTDLSSKVLEVARRGVYARASSRTTPEWALDRYLQKRGSNEGFAVAPEVRKICQFSQFNLVRHDGAAGPRDVDVALCRNVLIYLSKTARAAAVATIFERLKPGGYLLLGHSESLLHIPNEFDVDQLENDLVYRRSKRGLA